MAERIKGLQIDLSLNDASISKTITGVKREFKLLNSDLKLSANNFKFTEKSMESYKNRIRDLDKVTKAQREGLKWLKKEYQEVAAEQGANSDKAMKLRAEFNRQADVVNRLENELEQTVGEFKNFKKEADYAARATSGSLGKIGKQFTDLGPKFKGIGDQMKGIGQSMSMYVTAPIAAGFGLSVKTAADFEQEMARVGAISQSSKKDMKAMSDQAIELGANTSKSAQEVALGRHTCPVVEKLAA